MYGRYNENNRNRGIMEQEDKGDNGQWKETMDNERRQWTKGTKRQRDKA